MQDIPNEEISEETKNLGRALDRLLSLAEGTEFIDIALHLKNLYELMIKA